MDMKLFEKKLFDKALSSNFTDCEIYYVKSTTFSVNIFKGEINQFKNADSNGVGFRGTYNDKICYSYSEKVDESVIDLLIENAIVNCQLLESPDKEKLFFEKCNYIAIEEYNEALNKTTTEEKINMAKNMEKIIYSADSRVKSVNSCIIGNTDLELYISNTHGLALHSKSNFAYGYCEVNVIENGNTKVGYDKWIGRDFNDFDLKKIAKSSVDKAISQLVATSIKGGDYPTVFSNETSCDLLSLFSSSFLGEPVDKGFSVLKDKVNSKIASDIVTIRDDAMLENHLTNVAFDSEGVPTLNKTVVDKGILKTFLHNTKTASKFNVKPTGNGYKPSFKGSLTTGTTNFYIDAGTTPFDEMIGTVENGVFITELIGLNSGANEISGNFSLAANGFKIENGKITSPIEQITVAGNFFNLLFNITCIGDDLKFDFPSGLGAIGSPSILVSKLSISGI